MKKQEKIYIVGARLQEDDQREALESFKELGGLIETLGSKVVGRNFQIIKKVSKSHLFGKGKVEEIKEKASEEQADRIVFDYYLSPLQCRNLEESIKKPVVDRAGIIIEVFSKHAQTREGKLQVDLAQLKYKLPRLTDRNMKYDQQTGGGGSAYLRGAGEKRKELVQRTIRQNIRGLKKRIDKFKKHRQTQSKLRDRLKLPIVSLVGYTNAGKSTLLSALTGADILIQDKLFSTLDTTVRKRFYDGRNILFTDTVGFIRNLPVELVAAFRSTLEEVLSGWLLLLVFDVSNPDWKKHLEVVENILDDLGATHIPKVYVGNKVDKVSDEIKKEIVEELSDVKFISASKKQNTDELLSYVSETLKNL